MSKNSELRFTLSDSKELVKAIFFVNDKTVLDFENESPPPVRIRSPLPDKNRIIESGLYWVENDLNLETLEDWLDFYIQRRQKEVFEEIQEIRKSLKRIKHKTESMKIAKEAYIKYQSNKT
jgi:hypothetical protein